MWKLALTKTRFSQFNDYIQQKPPKPFDPDSPTYGEEDDEEQNIDESSEKDEETTSDFGSDEDPEDKENMESAQSLLGELASVSKRAEGAVDSATKILNSNPLSDSTTPNTNESEAQTQSPEAEEQLYNDLNTTLNFLSEQSSLPGADETLTKIRDEYSRLHKMFVQSRKNELALAKKCKEMASEFSANHAKVQAALKLAQSERMSMASLKKEVKRAWKVVESETEKEARAKEAITRLKMELEALKRKAGDMGVNTSSDLPNSSGLGNMSKMVETQIELENTIAKMTKVRPIHSFYFKHNNSKLPLYKNRKKNRYLNNWNSPNPTYESLIAKPPILTTKSKISFKNAKNTNRTWTPSKSFLPLKKPNKNASARSAIGWSWL
jgi:hypothetical protein